MFQRILVPLDGSERASQVLPLASRLARASGGVIILLRVVHLASSQPYALTGSLPSASLQTMLEVEKVEAMRYLADLASSPELSPVKSEVQVLAGPVASTILSYAAEQRCDLIVLARQGHSGSLRWTLGSVADKVLHHASAPVLLLNPDEVLEQVQALVALDGSAHAESALAFASQLAPGLSSSEQGRLTLLHVQPQQEWADMHMQEYLSREAQSYLAANAERLRQSRSAQRNLTITWSLLQGEDVAETLLTTSERRSAEEEEIFGRYNLLVLTTRGRGGSEQPLMGSITERIIRYSQSSLFLVEPLAVHAEQQQHTISYAYAGAQQWSTSARM